MLEPGRPGSAAPAYLLRDRDQVYGEHFRLRVKGMRIEEVLTAPHSPWQNPHAERLIGLDPPRVSRSCRHPGRKTPAPHLDPLLLVLSSGSHSSLARQGCARRPAYRAAGAGLGHAASRSRRPASSIRPAGGITQPRPPGPPPLTRPPPTPSSFELAFVPRCEPL